MNLAFLKSPHGEEPIIVEALFKVSPARLFKAWTTPDDIKRWFGSEKNCLETAEIELKVGGTWRFIFPEKDGQQDCLSGRYLTIEENKKLEFSWVHTRKLADGSEEESAESKVSVIFEARETGSFSRLVHETVSTEGARLNIGEGWNTTFHHIQDMVK